MTLQEEARDYRWLFEFCLRDFNTSSVETLAAREGVSEIDIRSGIIRALASEHDPEMPRVVLRRPPDLVPLFPVGPFVPSSPCPHRRAFPSGSLLCCMVCHKSSQDHHPALQRDPRTDPAPEPRPTPPPDAKRSRQTRKARRRELSQKSGK
jgi:hypothetical protein